MAAAAAASAPRATQVEAATPSALVLEWIGRDIDGDGAADVTNPTGRQLRASDSYGSGDFGATRDGGARRHVGADYVAGAGEAVRAPISGFITRIGYVYAGDSNLRYLEIDNPALKITARVFYVEPSVRVGQAVAIGRPLGSAQTLQTKYPDGITDHIHLELADGSGRKLDPATMIVARVQAPGQAAA